MTDNLHSVSFLMFNSEGRRDGIFDHISLLPVLLSLPSVYLRIFCCCSAGWQGPGFHCFMPHHLSLINRISTYLPLLQYMNKRILCMAKIQQSK